MAVVSRATAEDSAHPINAISAQAAPGSSFRPGAAT